MKVTLTFKNPDVLDQLDDQIEDSDELDTIKGELIARMKYGEYIYLEYDTETKELKVKE